MTTGVTPDPPPAPIRPPVLIAARLVAGGVLGMGALVLFGWSIGSRALSAFGTGVSMNPVTAICFGLAGYSLWTASRPIQRDWIDRSAIGAAGLIVAICSIRLIGYVAGWSGGPDRLLFQARLDGPHELFPNRMAPNTALAFLFVAGALGTARLPVGRGRAFTAWLCLPVLLMSLVTLAGYAYDVRELARVGRFIPMALNTSIGFVALATVTPLVRPSGRLLGWVLGDGRSLQQKVTWGLGLAIAIVMAMGGTSLWTSHRSQRAALERRMGRERMGILTSALRSAQDAELWQLAYLESGDRRFLDSYHGTKDSLVTALTSLRDGLASGSEDRVEFTELGRLGQALIHETDETIAAFERKEDRGPLIERVNRGRTDAARIRAQVERMTANETVAVARWEAVMSGAGRASLVTSAVAIGCAILFLARAGREIHRDLAGREAAESRVRESERQLAQIIEVIPQSITLKEPTELRVIGVNRAAEKLTGIPRAELLGQIVPDRKAPDRARLQAIREREALDTGKIVEIPEESIETRDRGTRILRTTKVPVFGPDQRPILLVDISEDITERRHAERALERSRLEAEAANRAKSDFLAKMSHELRTPLNSIIGFSEILEEGRVGQLNAKQGRYVANVLASGKNLLDLINDILDLAKVEAGRMSLSVTDFDVKAVLEDVRATLTPLAERRRQTLDVTVQTHLAPLSADRGKVTQILYNLVSNAIKFTPDGGRVTLWAGHGRRSEFATRTDLQFSVTDTGIGIKPEDQERVFLEFEQVDNARSQHTKGTGLGLALCRKFVNLHGGRIWVESEPSHGATFRFTIPAQQHEAALPRTGRDAAEPPLILVVDDEPYARELIAHHLLEAGYRVADAASGEQAIALASRLRPAAMTLDIRLPGWDGFDVLAHLKAAPATADVPVIIVSVTDQRQVGLSLGAVEWLVKPIKPAPLLAALHRALSGSDGTGQTALIIDDDPAVREVATHVLEPAGFRVITAAGGDEGISLAIREQPDVIVLDLLMPDRTGFEVIRELRAHPAGANIPILILTSKDLTASDRAQLGSGVQAIIAKGPAPDLLGELRRICPPPPVAVTSDA